MNGADLIDHSPSQPEAAAKIPSASRLVLIGMCDDLTALVVMAPTRRIRLALLADLAPYLLLSMLPCY